MLAAVVGTEGFSQINSDDNNNNNNINNNGIKIQLHVNCDAEERTTVASRSARCSGDVLFFNGSIGSWDPVETLKPTVLHELMEPTRGSQRKQMDFVCGRRRERRAITGWPLPVRLKC